MIIDKQVLTKKLNVIKSAIASKSDIPATEGVLLKGNTITAYNLEFGITTAIDNPNNEEFIIPAKGIEMIEALPLGKISIICGKENTLIIKSGAITHKVKSHPVVDFPALPEITEENETSFDFKVISNSISSVLHAVSIVDTKPVHMGVYFNSDDEYLNIVACDGKCLAWDKLKLSGTLDMVVPKNSLQKLMAIDMGGNVNINYSNSHVVFSSVEHSFYSRLLSGSFLEYKKAVPAVKNNSCEINKKEWSATIQRAIICLDKDKFRDPVILEFKDKEVSININTSVNNYSETLFLNESLPEELTIGVKGNNLLNALKACTSETVDIYLGKNPIEPIVIKDGELTQLVLPVSLKKYYERRA